MDGWIKLHRKILEWEWYGDLNTRALFIHLLLTVNHKDNKWMGITILSGSRACSYQTLSEETGITVQSVRTSITKLKSTGELTSKSNNKYTLITVNNYNLYQEVTSKLTNEQQATNKQLTTNKNDKNDKKERYTTIESITEKEIALIAEKYQTPNSFVRSRLDDMVNWISAKGKDPYKNHYSALCNWVKKDALKIKQGGTNGKFVIADI
ncbi:MAG: hypothetical protein WC479_03170 [Candidatus Izemoplasmatales bacterium]